MKFVDVDSGFMIFIASVFKSKWVGGLHTHADSMMIS
jgi:hypothetical protein